MRLHDKANLLFSCMAFGLVSVMLTMPAATAAAESAVPPLSLAQAQTPSTPEAAPKTEGAPAAESPVTVEETVKAEETAEPTLPISLGVSYYLLSDYVWRGINLSEHAREKGERLNHQMTTSFSWDTGTYGTFGFDTFFEWYADQKKLNPYGGQNLQEVDYVFRWGYSVEPINYYVTVCY